MNIKNEGMAGAAVAAGIFIWQCIELAAGLQTRYVDYHMYISPLSYLLPVAGVYWVIKKRYISVPPGQFQLKDGLFSGITSAVIAAILSIPFLLFFLNVINPDFFATMKAASLKHAILNGDNSIMAIQDANDYFKTSAYITQAFASILIIGCMSSFFISNRMLKKTAYKERLKKA